MDNGGISTPVVFIKGQKGKKRSSELGSLDYKRRCINEHRPTLNVFFNFSDLYELASQCLRELHSEGKTAFHSIRQRKEHKEKGGNKIVQETIRVRCSIDSYVTRRRVNRAPQQTHRKSDHGTCANSDLHLAYTVEPPTNLSSGSTPLPSCDGQIERTPTPDV